MTNLVQVPFTVKLVMTLFYSMVFFLIVILIQMAWDLIRGKNKRKKKEENQWQKMKV